MAHITVILFNKLYCIIIDIIFIILHMTNIYIYICNNEINGNIHETLMFAVFFNNIIYY